MLTRERFEAAREFVIDHARPIDRAIFRHLFEDGPAEDVHEELRAFRNDDGGFGHGIEPDFRLPESSVTATTVALQYLRDCKASSDDELVIGAVGHLAASFDAALGGWAPVPARVVEFPHAPWWKPGPDGPAASLHLDSEVVGYLHEYRELVDADFLAARTATVLEALKTRSVGVGSYAALGLQRLAHAAPTDVRNEVFAALCEEVPATIDADPAKWGEDFQPFWLLVEGASPLTERLADVLATSLDREIARQDQNGCWPPRWSWGADSEAWQQARREWAGEQTVRTLRALRVAGRLPS